MEQDHPGVTYEGFNVCQDWLCTWVWCCYFSSRSYDASAYVMARKMGGNAELMSSIVTFQVIVAFFTLPLFIYIADHL